MENFNDITDAFDGWLQALTGTRNSGSYVNGNWVEGAPEAISFNGVVQNSTPKDVLVLPEGMRAEESIKIHTTFSLIPNEGDTKTGDIISYNGSNWLVHNVAYRNIGGYNKAIAVKR